MRVEIFFTPNEIDESVVKGKTMVVIDVLRVSTTIAYALYNGCERIIPVESVEAATNLASSLDRKVTLLCGEKEGKRIDGFDLGNSPLEYSSDVVKGKTAIIATTNGTRAIAKGRGAKEILVASFVNLASVAEYTSKVKQSPVMIVCAGKLGRFSLEDAVCAGMLIERLKDRTDLELNDAAVAAASLFDLNRDSISELLKTCEHGRYLASIGFSEDLEVCGKVDSLKILPIVKEGRIDKPRRRRGSQ